ncbi:glutamate dehydrogenase [Seonamhaeicola sp. ML3]|uniref:THC0290_0291 family protein n=1 Tax=Seonamhaeicola sp. ML3 TaxID=2937786 RepID=UPI00200C48C4|nr:glutamate dehydrogenase [Seonamhaeicola sp. ML3]
MLNLKHLASTLCLLILCFKASAQLGFSHELGVITGPLQMRSDFGLRDETETNFGNSGFGVGIVHYINFSIRADCNCYSTDTYFNDHFKIRNEISWNRTNLEHFGTLVDPSRTSVNANQLRGHTGVSNNLDIGTQLEFFPLSIRSFQAFAYRVAPYVSLGVHYTSYTPKATTTYANPDPMAIGDITDASNFYSGWAPGSVNVNPGSTWSVVTSVGMRYKVTEYSDLLLDLRWQYYFSDWVDGLNHQLESNKFNDWLVWLNVGYIVYL